MVKLNEFQETATFAWSNDALPLIATGTLAGAMDANFSSDSSLKIFDPLASMKKEPKIEVSVEARFHSLAWSEPTDDHKKGLLAGALENGSIHLWDSAKLINTQDASISLVHQLKKHTGPVLSVEFNPLQSNILASSGKGGEILIWDTKKGTSFSPGQAMSPMDQVSCVSWNNNMGHIFASAGNTGYASIWDLKAKREVVQLTYSGPLGRSNLSVVAWHPTQSTKLVTASDSDGSPVVCTWDLRNANAPEIVMNGHKKGVLSIDWCKQDPSLLLTSGKDNTTFLWNPLKGEKLCEYPSSPNWVFKAKFAPKLPEVFASASFDKKLMIETLQDTSPPTANQIQSTTEDDFWNNLSSTDTQQPVFTKQQAPTWLKRPVSANFGFGGKIVTVNTTGGISSIKIVKYSKDSEFDDEAKKLTDALQKGNFKEVASSKSQKDSKATNSQDWKTLEKLLEKGKISLLEEQVPKKKESAEVKETSSPSSEGDINDEDFFTELSSSKKEPVVEKYVPKGSFNIISKDSVFETDVIAATLAGKSGEALDLCLKEGKILEALVLAINGSNEMKEKAKDAYFKLYADKSPFARVLYNISNDDITDIVLNSDISSWKNIIESIITFGTNTENFNKNIAILGDRLLNSGLEGARDNAMVCYIAGDCLEKLSTIWLSELDTIEKSLLDSNSYSSAYEARVAALGEVIEKIMVYQSTVKSSATSVSSPEDLKKLGTAYLEFTEALTDSGHFELAYKLLELIPENVPGVKLEKERVSKSFIQVATLKPQTSSFQPRKRNSYATPSVVPTGVPNIASPIRNNIPLNGSSQIKPSPYSPYKPADSTPAPPFKQPGSTVNVPPNAAYVNNPYQIPTAAPQVMGGNPPLRSAPPPLASQSSMTPSMAKNPYAPTSAIESLKPMHPMGMASTAPPPPPPSMKTTAQIAKPTKEIGGWNDLPVTITSGKQRQVPPPSAYNFSQSSNSSPSESKAPSRTASASQFPTLPPPPSRKASNSVHMTPTSTQEPTVRKPSKYAPSQPVMHTPVLGALQSPGLKPTSIQSPPANPYAPRPEEANNNIINIPQPMTNISAGVTKPAMNIPKNPYAPKANSEMDNSAFAPAPPSFGGAPANGFGGLLVSTPPPMRPNPSMPPPPPKTVQAPPAVQAPASFAAPPATSAAAPPPQVIASTNGSVHPEAKVIIDILSSELEKVKPKIPEKFFKQMADSEKRLNILFGHLSKSELVTTPTINELTRLSEALASQDFQTAKSLQAKIATDNADECGTWMTGLKRLIGMIEATANL